MEIKNLSPKPFMQNCQNDENQVIKNDNFSKPSQVLIKKESPVTVHLIEPNEDMQFNFNKPIESSTSKESHEIDKINNNVVFNNQFTKKGKNNEIPTPLKTKPIIKSIIDVAINKLVENEEAKNIYNLMEIKSLSPFYFSNDKDQVNSELIIINSKNEVVYLNDIFRTLKNSDIKTIKVIKIESDDIDIPEFILNNINKYNEYQSYYYLGMQVSILIDKIGGKQQGKRGYGSIWEKVKATIKVSESKARKLALVYDMYPNYLQRLDKNILDNDNYIDDETKDSYTVSLHRFYNYCKKFKALETEAVKFGLKEEFENCLKKFKLNKSDTNKDDPEGAYYYLNPLIIAAKVQSKIIENIKTNNIKVGDEINSQNEQDIYEDEIMIELDKILNKNIDSKPEQELMEENDKSLFCDENDYFIPCSIYGKDTSLSDVLKECLKDICEDREFQKITAVYMKGINKILNKD